MSLTMGSLSRSSLGYTFEDVITFMMTVLYGLNGTGMTVRYVEYLQV
jgi:hypothetical protein